MPQCSTGKWIDFNTVIRENTVGRGRRDEGGGEQGCDTSHPPFISRISVIRMFGCHIWRPYDKQARKKSGLSGSDSPVSQPTSILPLADPCVRYQSDHRQDQPRYLKNIAQKIQKEGRFQNFDEYQQGQHYPQYHQGSADDHQEFRIDGSQ